MTGGRIGERGGEAFTFLFDGQPVQAWPGASVSAAAMAAALSEILDMMSS